MKVEISCGGLILFSSDSLAQALAFINALDAFIHGQRLSLYVDGILFNAYMKGMESK